MGPESAGSNPGPACYRRGGRLTVTDANVMLGKIHPQYFPAIFGLDGNLPLDREIVSQKFAQLADDIADVTGNYRRPEQVAAGFIAIAVENMGNAIKKISLQRGYDVSQYVLCCFGGAGGQVACLIADTLGMSQIFLHPYAGVLSAYGMGLADIRATKVTGVEKLLTPELIPELSQLMDSLASSTRNTLYNSTTQYKTQYETSPQIEIVRKVNLKYDGTSSTLSIDFNSDWTVIQQEFETEHKSRYGFIQLQKSLIVESASTEIIQRMDTPEEPLINRTSSVDESPTPTEIIKMFTAEQWYDTPIYRREDLQTGDTIPGPAIVVEKISTIVVEPNWKARLTNRNHLILERIYETYL